MITYEAQVRRPEETLARVGAWLGLDGAIPADPLDSARSAPYTEAWREMATGQDPAAQAARAEVLNRFADRTAAFGYDLEDLDHEGDHGLPAP